MTMKQSWRKVLVIMFRQEMASVDPTRDGQNSRPGPPTPNETGGMQIMPPVLSDPAGDGSARLGHRASGINRIILMERR